MCQEDKPFGMCPACRIPLYLYRGIICGSKEDVMMLNDYVSLAYSQRKHVHCLVKRLLEKPKETVED